MADAALCLRELLRALTDVPGGTRAHREVGTPRTHRRYLGREDGTYGPIPAKRLNGMLGMPLSRTEIDGLYCCGDSTFPGQVRLTLSLPSHVSGNKT